MGRWPGGVKGFQLLEARVVSSSSSAECQWLGREAVAAAAHLCLAEAALHRSGKPGRPPSLRGRGAAVRTLLRGPQAHGPTARRGVGAPPSSCCSDVSPSVGARTVIIIVIIMVLDFARFQALDKLGRDLGAL